MSKAAPSILTLPFLEIETAVLDFVLERLLLWGFSSKMHLKSHLQPDVSGLQVTAEDTERRPGEPKRTNLEKVLKRKSTSDTAEEDSVAGRVAKRVSTPLYLIVV